MSMQKFVLRKKLHFNLSSLAIHVNVVTFLSNTTLISFKTQIRAQKREKLHPKMRNSPRDFDPALIQAKSEQISSQTIANLIEEVHSEAENRIKEVPNLHHLINCIDLTSLNATDTPEDVKKLADRACDPLRDLQTGLKCAAVCVYPLRVKNVVERFKERGEEVVKVACVAGAFPSGLYHLESRLLEVQLCVRDGANEVDVVVNRSAVLMGKWREVYDEIAAMRRACGDSAHLKVILASGELKRAELIYGAAMCAMLAGADFVKTSTGKESVNATLEAAAVMCQAIKAYHTATGIEVGFKPAGGIKTPLEALCYQIMTEKICGKTWSKSGKGNELFRIGASSLLDEVMKLL